MPPIMEVSFDARYGQPKDLVFNGQQYDMTSMSVRELAGHKFTMAVALDDENDDELELLEEGPKLVVFNCAVYARSDTDPAHIEDAVLRTVDASSRSASPLPPRFELTSTAGANHIPLFVQDPQDQSTSLPQASYPAPPQPQFGQLQLVVPLLPVYAAPPRATKRVMPPRSQVTDAKDLQYLFDLPVSMRASVQYIPPLHHNHLISLQNGQARPQGKQRRIRWQDEHVDYLYDLMELAMLTLNRPLERRDFLAITEALHRQFRGTSIHNIPYQERGYNTVHSYATRKQPYDTLVRRVLPDLSANRPQWLPKHSQ